MRGNILNTLLQVCLQDLNWLQYLVSNCLYHVLKDKTSENSAKKGANLNAYFWHFLTLAPLLLGFMSYCAHKKLSENGFFGHGVHHIYSSYMDQRLFHHSSTACVFVILFNEEGSLCLPCHIHRYICSKHHGIQMQSSFW